MGKYICKECRATFDIPHEYEERHRFTHGPFEKWSVCPHCGEAGYEEAVKCDVCGEVVGRSEINYISSCGDMVEIMTCDKCYDELEEEQ